MLRKAIAVVETAKRELPLTFVVGEALPDKVSRSFERLFGSFINNMYWDGMEDKWRDSAGTKVEQPPAPTEETPTEEKVGGDASNFKEFLESSGEKDVQIVDINQAEVNPPSSGWGDASSSAWDNQGGGWGDPQTSDTHDGEGAWENSGDWGTTETGWIIDEPSLMEWLGPTLLPLTHTTGIMERSTRQITKVVPLPQLTQQPTKKKGKGKSKVVEELVEEELEKRLAYMVVAPWRKVGDHQSSDAVAPYILPDSRGLVACDKEESQGGQESSDSSIHNPAKDEIIVLITPQTAEKLHVGMGLQGVWVQIARRDPNAEDEVVEGDSKKKKGAPGVNGEATKWWYLEQLMCAIPSYHADRPSTS